MEGGETDQQVQPKYHTQIFKKVFFFPFRSTLNSFIYKKSGCQLAYCDDKINSYYAEQRTIVLVCIPVVSMTLH